VSAITSLMRKKWSVQMHAMGERNGKAVSLWTRRRVTRESCFVQVYGRKVKGSPPQSRHCQTWDATVIFHCIHSFNFISRSRKVFQYVYCLISLATHPYHDTRRQLKVSGTNPSIVLSQLSTSCCWPTSASFSSLASEARIAISQAQITSTAPAQAIRCHCAMLLSQLQANLSPLASELPLSPTQ
jgi:hypothetical protein